MDMMRYWDEIVRRHFLKESKMSVDTVNHGLKSPSSLPTSNSENVIDKQTDTNAKTSLHAYHMWLKETSKNTNDKPDKNEETVKVEDEEEENGEENFQVDAVLERGPSPPESENSNSYEWSYEEQFKQLYELDNDQERKTFLDEYFEYMKRRGTPVSRIPIMAKQILDLFQLYNLVVKHGGLVQVIRNKQWSKITKGLNLPTSITSAAFTLRTQYLKYLYPYECAMHNFSTPKELQAAIDSNRRDRFSTLYHSEPTMTPSRDDRFGAFPMSACDYPPGQPRHHMPHPPMPGSQIDMRYDLKRPREPLMGKPYDKYNGDSPKVIILQDGTPSIAENNRNGKLSPPTFHSRARSPLRDSEMRNLVEMEAARRRQHHFPYSGKDWEGESRHAFEEETRRRLLEESRQRSNNFICKDKNCNGIDCQIARQDLHRHRPQHEAFVPMCSCAFCKNYTSRPSFSPTRREISRHHMDGASATQDNSIKNQTNENDQTKSSTPSPQLNNTSNEENNPNSPITTLKMKLPNISKGGNSIQISLEVGGITYEGVINATITSPKEEKLNGHSDDTSLNGFSENI